jgi:hypothetical protein
MVETMRTIRSKPMTKAEAMTILCDTYVPVHVWDATKEWLELGCQDVPPIKELEGEDK